MKWTGDSAKIDRAAKGDYERDRSTRGQLSQLFLRDLLADWRENGRSAIEQARRTKPEQYLRIIATTIPKEMLVGPSDSMTALLKKVNTRAKEEKAKALPRLIDAQVVPIRALGASQDADRGAQVAVPASDAQDRA